MSAEVEAGGCNWPKCRTARNLPGCFAWCKCRCHLRAQKTGVVKP